VNRTGQRILRAGLTDAEQIAAGADACAQHRSLIADDAAGFCSAAVNSKKEWHEEILNADRKRQL
jgi:hypothetical protein